MATLDSVMIKLRDFLSLLSTKMDKNYSTFAEAINALPTKKDKDDVVIDGSTINVRHGIYFDPVEKSIEDAKFERSGNKVIATVGGYVKRWEIVAELPDTQLSVFGDDSNDYISVEASNYGESVGTSFFLSVEEPSIDETTGKVTAIAVVEELDVEGRDPVRITRTSEPLELKTQGGRTITPTNKEQVAVESGVYTTGAVKVAAAKLQDKGVTPSLNRQVITPDGGNYGLSSVTVESIPEVERAETEIYIDSVYDTMRVSAINNQKVGYVTEGIKDAYAEITLSVDIPMIVDDNGNVTANAVMEASFGEEGYAIVTKTSEPFEMGISEIGDSVDPTSATADRIIGNGKQVTVTSGYYPVDRIIRSIATENGVKTTSVVIDTVYTYTAGNYVDVYYTQYVDGQFVNQYQQVGVSQRVTLTNVAIGVPIMFCGMGMYTSDPDGTLLAYLTGANMEEIMYYAVREGQLFSFAEPGSRIVR